MKFIISLILLACIILTFLYGCKKLGVDIVALLNRWSNQPTAQAPQSVQAMPATQMLYKAMAPEYQYVAMMLWNCLNQIRICGLNTPDLPSGIYAASPADRVKRYGGCWSFYYEAELAITGGIHDGKLQVRKIEYEKIAEIINENLPDYMMYGFYYEKGIFVCPVNGHSIRIEVQGVDRNCPPAGGIIL